MSVKQVANDRRRRSCGFDVEGKSTSLLCKGSCSFVLLMSVRLLHFVTVCLLLISLIQTRDCSVLRKTRAADVISEHAGMRRIRSATAVVRTLGKVAPGKDQLNAAHTRDTRRSMVASIVLVVGGVGVLITVGGLIGVVVYYMKEK